MSVGLVLGGARCLFADLRAFCRLGVNPDAIIAVNYAGVVFPGRLDHWVTLHPANFRIWEPARLGPHGYIRWGPTEHPNVDRVMPYTGPGSSGLFATLLGLDELGLDRIALAGMPMDAQGNVDGRARWPDKEVGLHREGWARALDRIDGRVLSMSGWTRELLGAPTAAWMKEVA